MTKQEAIQMAWGDNLDIVKDKCDSDGFINIVNFLNPGKISIEVKYIVRIKLVRPDSLKGLSTNNGWIKVESEADLPYNFPTECWFICYDGIYLGEYDMGTKAFYCNGETYHPVTHYQPIVKPNKPLY